MKSNIILTGFMGSGKTTVGKILAQELEMEFIDTDAIIEKRAGITINEIFEKFGEKHFRDLETEVSKDVSKMENKIVSTGGGIVIRKENVEFLGEKGNVFLLWASPEIVYDRLKTKTDRPLLKVEDPLKKIKELLDIREPMYKNSADHIIVTNNRDVEEIALEIKKLYLLG